MPHSAENESHPAPEGRVRVVYLVDSLKRGGVQSGVLLQAQHLDRDKYDLEVWSLRKGGWELVPELDEIGVRVVAMPVQDYGDREGILAVAERLIERRVALLSTQSFYPNIIGRIAAHVARTPAVIVNYHSNYNHRWTKKFVAWEQVLADDADRFICVSRAVHEALDRHIGLPEERVRVVYNGLDIEAMRIHHTRHEMRSILGLRADVPAIAMIGRLTAVKDVPTLIEAAPAIFAQHPEALILIVGDGEDREALKESVAQQGLTGQINFLGSRGDIAEILHAVDCVVLTSTVEGFPRVIPEAFVARAPVVATPAGGVTEIVDHGRNGLIVPMKNPRALADAVIYTLDDHEATQRRVEAAHDDVQAFGLSRWIEAIEAVTDETIEQRRDEIDALTDPDFAPPSRTALLIRYLKLKFRFHLHRMQVKMPE